MKFADIPGNEKIKLALRDLVDSDKLPHALMLCGPSGTGKMSVARAFMQYAHCKSPSGGEPCGHCAQCRMHLSYNHPDVHFIYPIVKSREKKIFTSQDRIEIWKRMLTEYPEMTPERWLDLLDAGNSQPQIYVDDSDYIIRADAYSSFSSRYKFFTIWLPEKLHPAAANKLLKVIEEPTEGTIFLLVSDNEAEVLPTISSRTRRFNMRPVPDEEISRYVQERFGIDGFTANSVAKLAQGRISKAAELAEHTGERDEFRELYQKIMRTAYARKPGLLREIGDGAAAMGREKLRRFLSYMSAMTRENFIYNLRIPRMTAMTPDEEIFSQRFSPFIHHGNVEEIVARTEEAARDIERNGNSKLVLFSFFLRIIPLLLRKAP